MNVIVTVACPVRVERSVGEGGDVEDVLLIVDDRAGRSGAGIGLGWVDVELPLADGDRVGARGEGGGGREQQESRQNERGPSQVPAHAGLRVEWERRRMMPATPR